MTIATILRHFKRAFDSGSFFASYFFVSLFPPPVDIIAGNDTFDGLGFPNFNKANFDKKTIRINDTVKLSN